MALAVGFLFDKLAGVKKDQLEKIQPTIDQLKAKENSFNTVNRELKRTKDNLEQQSLWLEERFFWADVLLEMRGALIRAEDATRRKFGHDTGVWIETMNSLTPQSGSSTYDPNLQGAATSEVVAPAVQDARFLARYGLTPGRGRMGGEGGFPGASAGDPGAAATAGAPAGNSNQVASVTIVCRGVSLTQALSSGNAASANTEIAFAFESALRESPLFEAKETQLTQKVTEDETTGTFTFGLTLKLKRPLKL